MWYIHSSPFSYHFRKDKGSRELSVDSGGAWSPGVEESPVTLGDLLRVFLAASLQSCASQKTDSRGLWGSAFSSSSAVLALQVWSIGTGLAVVCQEAAYAKCRRSPRGRLRCPWREKLRSLSPTCPTVPPASDPCAGCLTAPFHQANAVTLPSYRSWQIERWWHSWNGACHTGHRGRCRMRGTASDGSACRGLSANLPWNSLLSLFFRPC